MRAPDIGPLHTIETPNGAAHVRLDDVQAVLPTNVGQCTIVLRGGAAVAINKPTKEVAASLFGDAPKPAAALIT